VNELLHGRARNRAIKAVVRRHEPKLWPSLIRVRIGKGTARRWAHIEIVSWTAAVDGWKTGLTAEQKQAITDELVRERLIGQYPDDMTDAMYPCVSFREPRP
jgi:hypothetical protein